MNRKSILTLLLAGGLSAQAADYPYLTIEQNDGTKTSVAAQGLTLTYSGDYLIVGDRSISLSSLSRMYFSATDETNTDGISAASLTVGDAPAEVYDLNGRRMPAASTLPPGVYIIKQNGTTKKVQVK